MTATDPTRPGSPPVAAVGTVSRLKLTEPLRFYCWPAVAFLLVTVNPKDAVLVVTGAAAIATATASVAHQVLALLLFTGVASAAVAAPVLLHVVLGDRAATVLAAAKGWMTANGSWVMTVVLVVIGAVLLGNGVSGLRSG